MMPDTISRWPVLLLTGQPRFDTREQVVARVNAILALAARDGFLIRASYLDFSSRAWPDSQLVITLVELWRQLCERDRREDVQAWATFDAEGPRYLGFTAPRLARFGPVTGLAHMILTSGLGFEDSELRRRQWRKTLPRVLSLGWSRQPGSDPDKALLAWNGLLDTLRTEPYRACLFQVRRKVTRK